MHGDDTMTQYFWTTLNLFSLVMLFISVAYTGWLWHQLRKQSFVGKNLANKVAQQIHEGASKQETISKLTKLGFRESDVNRKYNELKQLFS